MRKKKGQAVLEIALVLPILIFVFCAMADVGRILYASANLNMITQEAVRLAGLGKSDSEIIQYVNDKVRLPDKNTMITEINPSSQYRNSGDYVTVKITYKVKYITPLMNRILPSPYDVNTESTIRVE